MCFSAAKWKREKVQDHKFDFVDVNEFKERSFIRRIKYSFVFMVVLKSVLVYIADLWTAGILLIFNDWSSAVKPKVPIYISKWIFLGCIFMSFALLAWDMKKARSIIQSKDISYAFTSTIAYRYYTLRSYAHYCFFCQINNSKKLRDEIAFFVFFAFKGWKRLVFAEAPRQAINAFTLYSILQSKKFSLNYNAYGDNLVQRAAMILMAFPLLIFVAEATRLVIAFLLYIPLLCHIRGNLKEYCCHMIDKRIGELLRLKSRKRIQKLKEEATADKVLGNNKVTAKVKQDPSAFRQPTLPTVALFESNQLPPYGATPPPPYPPSQSPMFDDHRTKSPDPYSVAGRPGMGPRPHAAGQRQQFLGRRNSGESMYSETTTYTAFSSSSGYAQSQAGGMYPLPPGARAGDRIPGPQPKRSYGNLAAAQAAISNPREQQRLQPQQLDYDDDPYGGTIDDYSEYGDGVPEIPRNDVNPNVAMLGRPNQPYIAAPTPIRTPNMYNNTQAPVGYDDFNYRPPPGPRSGSPTPSVGSNSSRGGGRVNQMVPSRYQQGDRAPKYNNYTQQGGRRGAGGGIH
ncbi:8795_t:CDS:2 [Paraglomus occultum]|uniref:8795_t:CDS:1 n=1 Tax=Paraglomus occultum TaxID=144539 RepID=A0A9N8ZHN4_9GLOM|nr:8795_t:CDS:2 [Paraglomus occultum]